MVPAAQGTYYLASGIWPIVHLSSFERVTGPKLEGWLVRTMGGLIAAVGAALLAGARGRSSPTRVLGIASAAALGAADAVYALRGRIAKVYLADAAVQGGVIALWAFADRRR
jgi:hypothetical protein